MLAVSALSFAQPPQILKLTGYPHIEINSITRDAQDNLYVTGGFGKTADFGGRQVTSDDTDSRALRFFAAKYDNNGTLLWLHTSTGVADPSATNSIIDDGRVIGLDNGGNVYILGSFISTTFTLDGVSLTNADQINHTADILLIKYTSDGKLLWAKRFGGSGDDQLTGMAIGPDGTLYTAGNTASPSLTFSPITLTGTTTTDATPILAAFDTSGTAIWAKIFPARVYTDIINTTGGDDQFESVALDSLGNVYVAGSLNADTSQIGDSVIILSIPGDYVVVFAKFAASDGHMIWEEHSNDLTDIAPQSVRIDKNNDPIFCGGFKGTVFKFAGLTLVNPNQRGTRAMALLKCLPSGTALWGTIAGQTGGADTTGGFFPLLLACSPNNDIFISGLAYSSDLLLYNGTHLSLSTSAVNLFLLKVDPNGNFNWVLDGTFFGEGTGSAIIFEPDNSIYFSGLYGTLGQELKFGNDSLPYLNFLSSFIMHLGGTTGAVSRTDVGISPSVAFPNPATSTTMIELPQNSGPVTIAIFDALGRMVETIENKNTDRVIIPCQNLSKGIYHYRVMTDSHYIATGKFVIE